ncbi:MAG: hypothetical protein KDE59_10885 [Anaerolineales bacterium]|nr:hypothetical protein [Anaerolineales bacterium]
MTEDILPSRKLNREEFAWVLSQGLGRAQLHVAHHGLDGVADLVLDACRHNQSYDPQAESSRADWLWPMIADTVDFSEIRRTILAALSETEDTWDLQQLIRLAVQMARNGDMEAEAGLQRQVLSIAGTPSAHDWLGAEEWVALKGAEGYLALARIYGQRLLDGEEQVHHIFVDEATREKQYLSLLAQEAETDEALARYLSYIQPVSLPRTEERERRATASSYVRNHPNYQLARILELARATYGDYPAKYALFGKHATVDELKTIHDQLLLERDPAVQLRLLWVFRRAPLPLLPDLVLDWAEGADAGLREAAIAALSNCADGRIHELARRKACDKMLLGPDSEMPRLFLLNYEVSDARLLTEALVTSKPDREDAHSLGFALLDLAEKHQGPELAEALLWMYEWTPCTICRHKALQALAELERLPLWVQQEACHDASPEIRRWASEKSEGLTNPTG